MTRCTADSELPDARCVPIEDANALAVVNVPKTDRVVVTP